MAAIEAEIHERLNALVAELPDLTRVLRGTVRKRYVRCRREGCRCQKSLGHGPVYYLSVSFGGGRSRQFTLDAESYDRARDYAENYSRLRTILEEISALNYALLHRPRVRRDRSKRS
jgi:hypothetical protein